MLDALARFIHARRRAVLIGTVVFMVVAAGVGGPVAGLLDAENDFDDPDSESIRASADIERATGQSASPDLVALVRLGAPVDSPAARAKLNRVVEALRGPDVAQVAAYRGPQDRQLVSRDGRSTYAVATLRSDADNEDVVDRVEERLGGERGVELGGGAVLGQQVGDQVTEDLARAEMLAAPLLLLLSVFVFRALVAGLLPVVVGMGTVLTTFLLMRGVNSVESMSPYALNLVIGLGLGLAIDYSLFVVSRFREEMEKDPDTRTALRATMKTAGRTVLFSSVTVAAALASLMVFPQKFLYSMGIGGTLVALAAAAVSLTLLPALLAALGPRVNAGSWGRGRDMLHREAAGEQAGFWYRLSRAVMRRPAPVAAGAAALMIAVGIPFLGVNFTGVDSRVLPTDLSVRSVDDALRSEFPPDDTSPVVVAARAPASERAAVEQYAGRLGLKAGVVGEPRISGPAGGLWRIDVTARGDALDDGSKQLVKDVRDVEAPFPVRVGGDTAEFLDQQSSLGGHLPLALAILAVTTVVILFVMTGSVVLPIKAVVMNLLTLSAALGVLVLVFQDGRFEGVLDYTSIGGLETSQAILLCAVAFGLSTDYGVFLLTRIKEARDAGTPDDEAVAVGLQRTGRIVTAAALLFSVALGAFATSEVVFIKQVGLGTVAAVLIDATIVRALLVPSLMKLLGGANWWAPRPLARLHSRIGLAEG
jgi:uncharacterized membrane protein YdfJ with MMPL/SSD domain